MDKLPPLPDEAFDGYREKTELVENRCDHRETEIVSGNELKCRTCTASWTGPQIIDLQNLLKNRA